MSESEVLAIRECPICHRPCVTDDCRFCGYRVEPVAAEKPVAVEPDPVDEASDDAEQSE